MVISLLSAILTLLAPSPPVCASSPSGRRRNATAPFSAASSRCRRWSHAHTAGLDAFLCNWRRGKENHMTLACRYSGIQETNVDVAEWRLTLGCSRLKCLQKRPTQRQTSCHLGAVCAGVSWFHPGNAPVEIIHIMALHAKNELYYLSLSLCYIHMLITLMAWSSLLLSFSSLSFCRPSSSSFPLLSRSIRSLRSRLSLSCGSSVTQILIQHDFIIIIRRPSTTEPTRGWYTPSIFLPVSWNILLFFLSSSNIFLLSSVCSSRRFRASASRSALDRNLG